MMKFIFFISILFHSSNWVEPLTIPIISNIQDIIGLAHDVGSILSGNIPFKNFFSPVANPINTVLEKLDGITEQIENLDTKLDDLLATIIARLPLEDNINTDIRDLQQLITRVDETYSDFLAYSYNVSYFDDDTLLEFITQVTSKSAGNIPDILNAIFNIIVPKPTALARVGLLENMIQRRTMMTPLEMCGSPISFQNRLLQIYNLISVTEMRAFVMTAFAYRLKMELKNSKSIGEVIRAQSGFIMRLNQYLIEFRKNMIRASREIFLCDPESLTDESTYVELKGLFTAYVINAYQKSTSCSSTCDNLWTWSHNRCYDYKDQDYCTKHRCAGLVDDCEWIGGDVDICEFPDNSMRRYDWIRSYSNNVFYGKQTNCDNGTYHHVSSRVNGFFTCSMCICKCYESLGSSKAIRTFSLRPQISNIDENKVVSDVKFTVKDKVIHIQIEEAPLRPIGRIDKNESSWIPLEKFEYFPQLKTGVFVQRKGLEYLPFERDIDYTFIREDHQILHLDEITAGPNYALTGVKLALESDKFIEGVDRRSISPLQLEIHVTPFDYANGKLIPTEENPSIWITPRTQPKLPPAYAKPREELGDGAEKVYLDNSVQNPPHLRPNKYIKFKQSTIFSDAGQSTLPFMDARPTAPANSLALNGLGLAYRGHKDYGGFIILKAMTLDLTKYMDSSMTNEQRKYYTRHFRKPVSSRQPQRRST